MPSFHGGYYRDDRFDKRKNEMQVNFIDTCMAYLLSQ